MCYEIDTCDKVTLKFSIRLPSLIAVLTEYCAKIMLESTHSHVLSMHVILYGSTHADIHLLRKTNKKSALCIANAVDEIYIKSEIACLRLRVNAVIFNGRTELQIETLNLYYY